MTPQPVIYHNPRCTKSRLTLQLLKDKGYSPTVVEYLQQGLNAEEVKNLLRQLGMNARQLMRTCEAAYKESGAEDTSLSEAALIQKFVEHPILLERPVVAYEGKARIGRPPENVLEILD